MISISEHVWGVSPAQDRVWALVCGLRPSEAGKRIYVTLRAFIDESIDNDGTLVLGGCIASAESWVAFTKDWERLLQHGLMDKSGNYYFKMSEMAATGERMSRVPGFCRIIEEHILGYVWAKINISDLRKAQSRIVSPGFSGQWDIWANPYYMAFHCLLYKFHWALCHKSEDIKLNDKIDFIFDDRIEKRAIISGWCDFIDEIKDSSKEYYGATPHFDDDKNLLPLQAADFWVWWVRKWYVEGKTIEQIRERDFGAFQAKKGDKKYLFVDINYDEEALATVSARLLHKKLGPDCPIYDLKFSYPRFF